jgi:hypothetical protein
MLLPVHATFGALARTIKSLVVASAITMFALVLAIPWVAFAIPPRTTEFRSIVMAPIVARARKPRPFVAAIVARPLVALPPRFFVAAVAPAKVAVVAAAAGFPVLETPGRMRLVPVATGRTIVAVESPRAPVVAVAARRVIIPAAERTLLALVAKAALALAGNAALVELLGKALLPTARGGTTLAARRAVTPAAGSVVFVVVAGHEGSHLG